MLPCVTYAAAQPDPLPQSEEENVPENENRGWLAIPALMLLAAAGPETAKKIKKSLTVNLLDTVV